MENLFHQSPLRPDVQKVTGKDVSVTMLAFLAAVGGKMEEAAMRGGAHGHFSVYKLTSSMEWMMSMKERRDIHHVLGPLALMAVEVHDELPPEEVKLTMPLFVPSHLKGDTSVMQAFLNAVHEVNVRSVMTLLAYLERIEALQPLLEREVTWGRILKDFIRVIASSPVARDFPAFPPQNEILSFALALEPFEDILPWRRE